MTGPPAVAIDLDGVLGDTRPLWDDWLASASTLLGLDPARLPEDRGEAATLLDRDAGNWRALLERFAEERVAVYLRRDPATGDALRALAGSGRVLGVFTDAPEPLARAVLNHLGAERLTTELVAGAGALERLQAALGADSTVVRSHRELLDLGRRV